MILATLVGLKLILPVPNSKGSKGGMKVGGIFPIKSPYMRDPSSYPASSHLLRPPKNSINNNKNIGSNIIVIVTATVPVAVRVRGTVIVTVLVRVSIIVI